MFDGVKVQATLEMAGHFFLKLEAPLLQDRK
jgi:hypothetical protein